uniref:Uncharacterized protein n=1 Tax=Physcomitrium patens TaxID=3218 RepID=A0A2K1KEK3_PHYPA|nr:hypothetical protein PHYPA_008576 [Physcomitrium patens]
MEWTWKPFRCNVTSQINSRSFFFVIGASLPGRSALKTRQSSSNSLGAPIPSIGSHAYRSRILDDGSYLCFLSYSKVIKAIDTTYPPPHSPTLLLTTITNALIVASRSSWSRARIASSLVLQYRRYGWRQSAKEVDRGFDCCQPALQLPIRFMNNPSFGLVHVHHLANFSCVVSLSSSPDSRGLSGSDRPLSIIFICISLSRCAQGSLVGLRCKVLLHTPQMSTTTVAERIEP